MKEASHEIKAARQEQARERASDRDVEFLFWFVRLAADARKSAENKERDGLHGNLVPHRDNAVTQLMKYHRAKEKRARNDAEHPVLL